MNYRVLIICGLLANVLPALAQQRPENPSAILQQQAVQTCIGIRDGIEQMVNISSSNVAELSRRARQKFNDELFESLIESFDQPEMQALVESATRNYRRTGRANDLTRSLNNNEAFLVPCTEIQIERYRLLTSNFVTDPGTVDINDPNSPGGRREAPDWMQEAPEQPANTRARERDDTQAPTTAAGGDYGTSRR
jgi:hypothetical protein